MRRWTVPIAVLSILCLALALPALTEESKKDDPTPAGQQVFVAQKCQMCHTVYSTGIGEPPAEDAKEEEEEAAAAAGPPDLSIAGAGRTAEWISLYLQKKETLNDKKHMKSFKGSDEDLAALVDWVLTLKPVEEDASKAEKATDAAVEKAAEGEAAEESEGEAAEKDHDCGSHDSGDQADKDADTEAKEGE